MLEAQQCSRCRVISGILITLPVHCRRPSRCGRSRTRRLTLARSVGTGRVPYIWLEYKLPHTAAYHSDLPRAPMSGPTPLSYSLSTVERIAELVSRVEREAGLTHPPHPPIQLQL